MYIITYYTYNRMKYIKLTILHLPRERGVFIWISVDELNILLQQIESYNCTRENIRIILLHNKYLFYNKHVKYIPNDGARGSVVD
jgi:hypothetical protein